MIFHNYSWPRQYVLSFLTILLNLLVLSVFKVPERYSLSDKIHCHFNVDTCLLPALNVHTYYAQ